jgi:hypothetical protein
MKYIQDPLVTRFTRQVQSHSNGMLGEVIMLNVFRRIKVNTILSVLWDQNRKNHKFLTSETGTVTCSKVGTGTVPCSKVGTGTVNKYSSGTETEYTVELCI